MIGAAQPFGGIDRCEQNLETDINQINPRDRDRGVAPQDDALVEGAIQELAQGKLVSIVELRLHKRRLLVEGKRNDRVAKVR